MKFLRTVDFMTRNNRLDSGCDVNPNARIFFTDAFTDSTSVFNRHSLGGVTSLHGGDAENARPENAAPDCVENAGLEIAGPICRTGKCRKRHCMERRTLLMSI